MSNSNTLFQTALKAAADLLARRNHSEKQLREKLSAHFDETTIEAVLNEVVAKRWMPPPEELAQNAAQSWAKAGKSAQYISEHLQKLGLPSVEMDEESELQKMQTLLLKKFKDWQQPSDTLSYEVRAKAYRFLKYRGFEDSLIEKVIGKVTHYEEP